MEQARKREIINSVLDAMEEAKKALPDIDFSVNHTTSTDSLYVHMYKVNEDGKVEILKTRHMFFDMLNPETRAKVIIKWLRGLANEQEAV